jgi:hypothetical protein
MPMQCNTCFSHSREIRLISRLILARRGIVVLIPVWTTVTRVGGVCGWVRANVADGGARWFIGHVQHIIMRVRVVSMIECNS